MWGTLINRLVRASGPSPRLTLRRQLFDIAFALALVVGGVRYVFEVHTPTEILVGSGADGSRVVLSTEGPPVVRYVILTLVLGGILTQRRRYPLAVFLVVAATTLPVVDDVPRITYYTCVVAAYTAAAYSPYRLPTMLSTIVLGLLAWSFTRDGMPTIPQQYVGSGVFALVVLAGLALWLWRSRFEEGQLRLVAAERERAAELRRAIESERSRIARELHDVVTHNVSVMLIQAGAARRTMPTAPDQAREALLAVEGAGRTAMAELRHVMGLLTPDTEDAALSPQPGLSDLATLVARVREAGMPVELTIAGTPRPVPAGEALAAYRVVQEGLTNAVKHAAGASATVTVRYDERELRVEVADSGRRRSGPSLGTSGSARGPDPNASGPSLDTAGSGAVPNTDRSARSTDTTRSAPTTDTSRSAPTTDTTRSAPSTDTDTETDRSGRSLHTAGSSPGLDADGSRRGLLTAESGAGPHTDGSAAGLDANGSGRGLLGLRERLAVYGGTLRAGPVPNGFRISAVIPLGPP